MWILMTDTYVGGIGTFPKGHKLDLPQDTIKQLPKKCFKETCAPWEKHVDKQAVELAAAQNTANDSQAKAEQLAAKAEELKQKADSLVKPTSQKQAEAKKAEQAAKQQIAQAEKAANNAEKSSSEGNLKKAEDLKAKAWHLAREAERKSAELQLAHSELSAALAMAELKRLDAEDAKRQARAAVEILNQLKEEIAMAKAKETDDAKSETEQPANTVDQSVDQSVEQPVDEQRDGVAEGQTVPTGQAG